MGDPVSTAALVLVAVLLGAGVVRQFGRLGPRGVLLDALAVLPQWKFFAQQAVGSDEAVFDDHHLLVRGAQGGWQPLLWHEERRWHEAAWNPQQYSRAVLLAAMANLAGPGAAADNSQAALILMRHALEERFEPLQLAIARTRGRGARVPQLVWLSPWFRA